MAHAPKPNRNPSAALFNRSVSYQQPGTPVESDSEGEDSTSPLPTSSSETFAQTADVRRAQSLRTAGHYGGASTSRIPSSRIDPGGLSSFGAAGSTLTSPALSVVGDYTPPAAARHALFAHHGTRPSLAGFPRSSSPSVFSEPGVIPPSPTESTRSGGFSPASAFLSHFSSNSSIKPQNTVAPDALGAKVLSYTLGKLVGRGGFSSVREAIHENGQVLACKIVKRDDLSDRSGSLERFEEEIKIWQSLPRHDSFLPLLEMHRTSSMTFLVTPLLSGGSLLDVLKREHGSEDTARKWFPGVVAAVAALHEGFDTWNGKVLHGDLKLDNFLVDLHGHVVVCDFYMCRKLDAGEKMYTALSTIPPPLTPGRGRQSRKSSPFPPVHRHTESEITDAVSAAAPFPSASMPYAPPELLRPPPRGPALSQDVWAVGCILYALLTGRLPFVDSYDPRLQMKILKGHWEQPVGLGKEWVECLHGCLDINMDTRWDIKRVRESDAVVGWREVKPRSKSRSRSRMRGGYRDGSRGPGSRSRGPPSSQERFQRGQKDSLLSNAPQTQPMSIRRPQSKEHLSPYLQPGSASHDSLGFCPSSAEDPSGSASGSRSRSTGRSRSTSRKLLTHQQDLSSSLDYMNINRGRSTATKGDYDRESPVGSWQWNQDRNGAGNRSRSRDISMTPHTPRTASASGSRPRNAATNNLAVPHTAPLPPTLSASTTYPDDSPTRSQSRGRARYSDKLVSRNGESADSISGSSGTSPNISRRSTSRSRNSPDRGWMGNALGIVEEDKAWSEMRDHVEPEYEYRGRSVSRRGGR